MKLQSNERVKREGALYVEGDTNLSYGVVITAMAVARDAGVAKVMMLTSPSDVLKLDQLDLRAGPPVATALGATP